MTDLVLSGPTMTSLQIAETTGKQHKNVLRAIRGMEPAWEKIKGRKFALQFRINRLVTGGECKIPYYELTKTECLYIATKFNDEARARLILRWEELEKERSAAKREPESAQTPSPVYSTQSDRGREKCAVFFADSEELCNFAAFTREGHSFKASPENINGIKSAEVSCVSNGAHLNGVSSLVNSTHPRTFLFMFTRENQVCLYNGSPVTFKLGDGTTTVNATQMAKPFGKLVADWQRQKSTREFLNTLSTDMGIPTSALIQTVKGGNGEQGTWMHEDVALEFARWLSPKFAIWCNRRIKELLTAWREPESAQTLPPPIENQRVTPQLVEVVDGKAVTTSRKLAEVLGREHNSILETIKNNRHQREFKHGNFKTRNYTSSRSGHGYEFLITRKGLEKLAGIMRYNAKKRIAEVYKEAWRINAKALPPVSVPEQVAALPPVPEPEPEPSVRLPQASESPQKCLPGLEAEAADSPGDVKDVRDLGSEETDEIRYTPEQQKYIDWLEEFNGEAVDRMRKARATAKMYTELYEDERCLRKLEAKRAGYWHDLYEDIMLRLLNVGNVDELLEKHNAFKKRISGK